MGKRRCISLTAVDFSSRRVALSLSLAIVAFLLLLRGVSLAVPVDVSAAPAYDSNVAHVISQVTTRTLAYELAGLTGERTVIVTGSPYTIATRNSYQTEAISIATRYAYEQFDRFGLVVTYHNYTYSGYHWRNVVAEKPGESNPSEIYLLTAHVDSLPPGPVAPGADDNGSGSVTVLQAARLLAPHRFEKTLRFVLFTGEEQGLRGSMAYASDCKARGEDIRGVVNLDMIAYNSDGLPAIDLHASTSVSGSLELAHVFSETIGIYGLELTPEIFTDSQAISLSDQWGFLEEGYPAFLAIEDEDDFTPFYHKVSDTLATLDLNYYADFARAGIATIARLGGLLPGGYLSGTVQDGQTGQPLVLTVDAFLPHYHYTFTASTGTNGAYSMLLPVGSYTVTVRKPFYYLATIADVHIMADTVVTRNVVLEPWPRLYLPWVSRG